MVTTIVWFVLVVLSALLVGTMFGVWVGFDPESLSASAYVEQQQNAIRSFNTLLPAMGGACIVAAGTLAYLSRNDSHSPYLLLAAAMFLIAAALVTRFANQPINSLVMTWSPHAPPANWMQLRDQWWHWHIVRSVAGIAALVLTVAALLVSNRPPV